MADLLTSSLLDQTANEAVFAAEVHDDWHPLKDDGSVGHMAIVLPDAHAGAYRLQVVEALPRLKYGGNALLVSALLSNAIFYVRASSL